MIWEGNASNGILYWHSLSFQQILVALVWMDKFLHVGPSDTWQR